MPDSRRLAASARMRAAIGIVVFVLVERADGADGLVEEFDLRPERHRGRSRRCARSHRRAAGRAWPAGSISKPVTRQLAGSQSGLAPISARAWAMSSPPVRMLEVPQAERPMAFGIAAEILEVAGEQVLGRFLAERPGGGRGHGAVVERIEIAPGGQDIEPPARRRAGGAGRDEAAVEARRAARRSRCGPQARRAGRIDVSIVSIRLHSP